MSLKLQHKHSSAAGTKPATADLVVGELAINAADLILYTKNAAGAVVPIAAPVPPIPTVNDASGAGSTEVKGLWSFSYIPTLNNLP